MTAPAFDAEGRRWPILSTTPRNHASELESTIAKLSAELNLRCTQVADLYNVQQQQANEILTACDEIDHLVKAVHAHQETIAQRETEAVAAKQKLILLAEENITLRLQLRKAQKESTELLQRLLDIKIEFNESQTEIAATLETNSQLNAELIAARNVIEKAKRQHCNEISQQKAQFKDEIRKLEIIAAKRHFEIKYLEAARAGLVHRCDNLSRTTDTLESEKSIARTEFMSEASNVFELVFGAEREAAATIAAELQSGRMRRVAAEPISAEIDENIVLHLPLVELRSRPTSSESDTWISKINAA